MKKKESASFEQERENLHRQLLSSVSHDLKTPLASIIGSLEIHSRLAEKLSPEKKKMLLDTALEEAYRLDGFVTNILDMAKLENRAVKPLYEPYNFSGLQRDCKNMLGYTLNDCKLTVSGTPQDLTLVTDPVLLVRAISILIDNAARYAGDAPVIDVTYATSNNQVTVQVRDYGPGIPAGQMEEIFSKYTRLSLLDHKNAGTGLGLAICRSLVHLLGGTIAVANPPEGAGVVFTLALPA